jgi:hypothetical protein
MTIAPFAGEPVRVELPLGPPAGAADDLAGPLAAPPERGR